MSIAAYAYESNDSKYLKSGAMKLYIKDGTLIFFDGTTEHPIHIGEIETYDPTVTINSLPFINDNNEVVSKDQTVAASIDNSARLLATLLLAMTIGDTIKFNKDITINGVTVKGISNEGNDEVQLFTQEYYDAHKSELKGEKGDKGDKGDTGPMGPQGPKGDNGLDGKDGEDGEDAANWVWDLINSGLSAGSYAALAGAVSTLQTQIAAVTAANAATDGVQTAADIVDQIGDAIDDFSEFQPLT